MSNGTAMLKLLLYFVMIVVGADHSLATWQDASLTKGRVYCGTSFGADQRLMQQE
jgi:hypothetical protein